MNDIKSFVLQQFKDAFPNFNWRIGSMIRELLVEPLAYMSEILDKYTNYLNNLYNLDYVLDNPDECALEIDTWMRRLNIQTPQQSSGSGKVAILVDSQDDLVIPRGTVFVWGDTANVFVEADQKFSLTDGTLKRLCYGCYKLVVDVVTVQDTSTSLSCGAPLTWSAAPESVTDIYVESPITGGIGELSYTAKADLIRSTLTTPAICGEPNILVGLQRQFPDVVADVKTLSVSSPGVSGVVPLVLKQRKLPVTSNLLIMVQEDSTIGKFVKIPKSKLLYIHSVNKLTGEELPYKTIQVAGDVDNITIGLESIGSTEVAAGERVSITVFQTIEAAKCLDWLNASQVGSPYKFVDADPAVAFISLELNTTTRGTVTETDLLEIQEYINHSKINQTIADGGMSAILQAQGRTILRPVTYRGTVYYRGEAKSFCSSGVLNLSALGVFPGVPTVAYTTIDKIKIIQQ